LLFISLIRINQLLVGALVGRTSRNGLQIYAFFVRRANFTEIKRGKMKKRRIESKKIWLCQKLFVTLHAELWRILKKL